MQLIKTDIIDLRYRNDTYSIIKSLNSNQTNSTQSKISTNRPWDFGEISLLVLLIFGTVGNVLSIVVINRKRMRSSTASLLITTIAISDISVLFFKFLSNMIKIYKIPIFSWLVVQESY